MPNLCVQDFDSIFGLSGPVMGDPASHATNSSGPEPKEDMAKERYLSNI
jgi:hypothetical protein